MKKTNAFTLIELLIVVAIIGILAAIAVPNFINAQVRAKIARVQSEFKSIATAMETYSVDQGSYPYPKLASITANGLTTTNIIRMAIELTTPVAYMSSVEFPDPFFKSGDGSWAANIAAISSYTYVSYNGRWQETYLTLFKNTRFKGYGLASFGPDKIDSGGTVLAPLHYSGQDIPWGGIYQTSNGLYSGGDIVYYGGAHNMPINMSN